MVRPWISGDADAVRPTVAGMTRNLLFTFGLGFALFCAALVARLLTNALVAPFGG